MVGGRTKTCGPLARGELEQLIDLRQIDALAARSGPIEPRKRPGLGILPTVHDPRSVTTSRVSIRLKMTAPWDEPPITACRCYDAATQQWLCELGGIANGPSQAVAAVQSFDGGHVCVVDREREEVEIFFHALGARALRDHWIAFLHAPSE